MNILLINVPSRKGISGFHLPVGLLYVGAIINRCGHAAKIIDPYLDDFDLKDIDSGSYPNILSAVKDIKPSIIGYGGIATSYGRAKRIARVIRNHYPDILQIAGGALSSLSELLLTKAGLDLVFHGETELSLPIFLEKYERKESLADLPGVSYLSDEGKVIRTHPAEQVKDLDSIPFPAYQLVDISKYLDSLQGWIGANKQSLNGSFGLTSIIKKIGNRTHYIPITTARGCTHRCLFCYRHMQGVRQHSPAYVIRHIKFLKNTYGVEGFEFSDELFNSHIKWINEFCDLIEKEALDIFYLIGGARIDKMDETILRRLKSTGCIEINYGHESGSDTILKEYRKGISAEQNRGITILTKRMGIACPIQIVIGSPSETDATIRETINFLKSVDGHRLSWNYLIPLPHTPVWEYVQRHKLVVDVEDYLDKVAQYGGLPLVNLTKMPDDVWRAWSLLIRKELNLDYYKKTSWKKYYFYRLLYFLTDTMLPLIPFKIRKLIPRRLKSWYWVPKA